MKEVRSGLDRYLSSSPYRNPFSIIRDRQFKKANEVLDAHAWATSQNFNHCERVFVSAKTAKENLPSPMPLPWYHSSAIVAGRNQSSGDVQTQIVQQRVRVVFWMNHLTRIFTLLRQICLLISEIAGFIAATFISALQTERLGRCRERWLWSLWRSFDLIKQYFWK